MSCADNDIHGTRTLILNEEAKCWPETPHAIIFVTLKVNTSFENSVRCRQSTSDNMPIIVFCFTVEMYNLVADCSLQQKSRSQKLSSCDSQQVCSPATAKSLFVGLQTDSKPWIVHVLHVLSKIQLYVYMRKNVTQLCKTVRSPSSTR